MRCAIFVSIVQKASTNLAFCYPFICNISTQPLVRSRIVFQVQHFKDTTAGPQPLLLLDVNSGSTGRIEARAAEYSPADQENDAIWVAISARSQASGRNIAKIPRRGCVIGIHRGVWSRFSVKSFARQSHLPDVFICQWSFDIVK